MTFPFNGRGAIISAQKLEIREYKMTLSAINMTSPANVVAFTGSTRCVNSFDPNVWTLEHVGWAVVYSTPLIKYTTNVAVGVIGKVIQKMEEKFEAKGVAQKCRALLKQGITKSCHYLMKTDCKKIQGAAIGALKNFQQKCSSTVANAANKTQETVQHLLQSSCDRFTIHYPSLSVDSRVSDLLKREGSIDGDPLPQN